MGAGAVIYVPSFIKIGSGIQRLIKGGYTNSNVIPPSSGSKGKPSKKQADYVLAWADCLLLRRYHCH
jgi:hypothetical protein